MKNHKILRAIGGIDEEFIERAATKNKTARPAFAPWLKWAVPVAACLVLAVAIAVPTLLRQPSTGNVSEISAGSGTGTAGIVVAPNDAPISGNTDSAATGGINDAPIGGNIEGSGEGSASGGAAMPRPSLTLDNAVEYESEYIELEYWRGLSSNNHVLEAANDADMDRNVFLTLDDLAEYADAFLLIANVNKVMPDSENMQSAIAEYALAIGDGLNIRQWDGHTVSTENEILIRQQLIGGCAMDEPNNLLRVGGVYVLPLTFYEYWGAYEVVGDLDVLFELDNAGKMMSHSRWEGFNQYDGMTLPDFMDVVRGLYS